VQQVNIHDPAGQSTYCHQCDQLLIGRDWYDLIAWNLDADGRFRPRKAEVADDRCLPMLS